MEYASAVEQERDECRDALLKVVEKGGYSLIPTIVSSMYNIFAYLLYYESFSSQLLWL